MEKLNAFRILPVLMIVAAICFGMRFSEMIGSKALSATELATLAPAAGQAQGDATAGAAKTKTPSVAVPQKGAAEDAAPAPSQESLSAKPVIEAPTLGAPPSPPKAAQGDWKGADDLDDQYSDVKMELFNDLAKRRKDIEAQEKALSMREALLKAGQAELEQKYEELTIIKGDIEQLLTKQTEEENKRIASLVKIYEGMKAKDAARIFDSLDMDVLLQVMTKMSERKSAPIIAAMNAEKARNVTIMLAEQNKLPSLPSLPGGLARP